MLQVYHLVFLEGTYNSNIIVFTSSSHANLPLKKSAEERLSRSKAHMPAILKPLNRHSRYPYMYLHACQPWLALPLAAYDTYDDWMPRYQSMTIDKDVFSIQGNHQNGNFKRERSHHHQGSSFAPMLSAEEFSRRLIPRGDVAEQENFAAVGLDQLRGADMHNALPSA
jgi:hypothetical protein